MATTSDDVFDLVRWLEERKYSRERTLALFEEVVKFIDVNSTIHAIGH